MSVESLKCSQCKQTLPVSEFYRNKSKRNRGGYCTECKSCQRNNGNTLTGFLTGLWNGSKKNSKIRANDHGKEPMHSLTLEDTMEMWESQDGCCFYTGLPMAHAKKTLWQASIERLNPAVDYTKDNCVLVVWEMNGSAQWSSEKTRDFLEELKLLDYNEAAFLSQAQAPVRRASGGSRIQPSSYQGDQPVYLCNNCKTEKPRSDYEKGHLRRICRDCRYADRNEKRRALYGYICGLLSAAKLHAKKRSEVTNRVGDSEFALTKDDILQILIQQKGLCAYSGIRLRYGSHEPWRASIERIDNNRGYHKDNICWVCHEFNVAARVVTKEDGSDETVGGWTREKIQTMTASLRAKLGEPAEPAELVN